MPENIISSHAPRTHHKYEFKSLFSARCSGCIIYVNSSFWLRFFFNSSKSTTRCVYQPHCSTEQYNTSSQNDESNHIYHPRYHPPCCCWDCISLCDITRGKNSSSSSSSSIHRIVVVVVIEHDGRDEEHRPALSQSTAAIGRVHGR